MIATIGRLLLAFAAVGVLSIDDWSNEMTDLSWYCLRPDGSGAMLGIDASKPPPPNAACVEVSVDPVGEWRAGAAPTLEIRDAVRVFRRLDTGELFSLRLRGYETRASAAAPKGHDICFWCGHDNGPHGESRQGWDCAYCGGN